MKQSPRAAIELVFWVVLILGLLIFLEHCADRDRAQGQAACRARGGQVVQQHADDPKREGWMCIEAPHDPSQR